MLRTSFALALHILGATVWVGGMFAAYVCLRPAAGSLEGPQRLRLWRNFFAKFFPWVWVSVLLLLASGYWMLVTSFGGFAHAPLYINLMQAISWVMIALFAWLFFVPWREFKFHIDAEKWSAAGANLARIDKINLVNLLLGIIAVVTGSTGPYWQ